MSQRLRAGRRRRSRSTWRRPGQRKAGSGLDLAIAVGVLVADRAAARRRGRRARLRRRARPRRHAPAGARRGADGRRARRRRRRWCRPASSAEAHVAARGVGARGRRRWPRSSPRSPGEAPWPGRPAPRRRRRRAAAARPRRRPRPAGRPAGAGDRRRRRAPPAVRRAARVGQDDARPAPARPAAAARPRRRARGDDGPLGGRRATAARRPRRAGRRSGRRTTRARRSRSSAAARRRCGPARSRLAHGGVLFLDELGEFAPHGARRPAPTARGGRHPGRPGRTPAPSCRPGSSSSRPPTRARAAAGRRASCECDDAARLRYLRRLSGPLLDRFDLRVARHRPDVDDLLDAGRRRVAPPSSPPGWPRPADRALARLGRAQRRARTATLLDALAPLDGRGAGACCAPRWSATG